MQVTLIQIHELVEHARRKRGASGRRLLVYNKRLSLSWSAVVRNAVPFKTVAAFCLLLIVAGCSTAPTSRPGTVVTDGTPVDTVAPPPTTPAPEPSVTTTPGSAYAELLERAGSARSRGEYQQALALLERAQRIEPGSARIYLDLAVTHRARGDLQQAKATAERGMLYCTGKTECEALRALTQ